jgi:hypothetical protein
VVVTFDQFRSLCPVGYARLTALARSDPTSYRRCMAWLMDNVTAVCDVPSTLVDHASITWSMVGAVRGVPVAEVTFGPARPFDWAEGATPEALLSVAPVPQANAIKAPSWQDLHPCVAAP